MAESVNEVTWARISWIIGVNKLSNLLSGITKALVLDDDEDTRFAICRILSKCNCEVVEAESVEQSVEILEQSPIDIVFSDMRIPGSDGGEELLNIVTEKYPNLHIVLMSCAMDKDMRETLMSKGATDCLQKPFYKDACEALLDSIRAPLKKSA